MTKLTTIDTESQQINNKKIYIPLVIRGKH